MTHWLAFMTRTDGSRALYLLKAFGLTLAGTVAFTVLAVTLFPAPETGASPEAPPFLGFVIAWPAMSTLLIWIILAPLKRLLPTYWHAAGAAAMLIAGLFALAAGLQGGMIFAWPYFVYSLVFLAWQLRSDADGVLMAFGLQAAVNLLAALVLFPPPG